MCDVGMYSLIREYADLIIKDYIGNQHVQQYDWLTSNLMSMNVSTNSLFKQAYKKFWAMNAARLTPDFFDAYFVYLEENKHGSSINIREVCDYLYSIPTDKQGDKSLQFSFASKLVHMISPIQPIYDSRIRQFYFLPDGQSSKDFSRKISELMLMYGFLKEEYKRIIEDSLLKEPIIKFRQQLKPKTFTDEKVIDSLIWGFVSHAGISIISGSLKYT